MKATALAVLCTALIGCTDHGKKLAADQAAFEQTADAQVARLDRKLEDSTVRAMLLHGAMTEHSAAVLAACRAEESKTPTCAKLYARVAVWQRQHAKDDDARLRAEGVTQ